MRPLTLSIALLGRARVVLVVALLGMLRIEAGLAGADESVEPSQDQAGVNLALVAKPSASYVSPDTTVQALNDGHVPNSSRDRRHSSYGNWPRRGTQWVQYEWPVAISTRKIDVYWWDDGRGVRLPKSYRLLYWDGQRFRPVRNACGLGTAADCFNTTTFDEVRTTRLRLEIQSRENFSTGLLEWRVYDSGQSPPLPPVVQADHDRICALGGRTWVGGTVKAIPRPGEKIAYRWQKVAGPGRVMFANPNALHTTATFSQTGNYRLRLTVHCGSLNASSDLIVRVISPPSKPLLDPIDVRPWKVDSPLWTARLKAVVTTWLPHCIAKISDPDLPEGGINNFISAANKLAGKPYQPHRGYVFSNAWVLNTLEAICYALMLDAQGDADVLRAQQLMRATLEDWIPKILAAQEPDGYLQTAFTLNGWEHWSAERRWAHEGYVAGYFLDAAIAHYLLTGGADKRLYDAARKLADCWYNHIGPPPKKAWFDGHQGMEMSLIRFGRFVNHLEGNRVGDKYIKLAKFLLDCRRDGQPYDQSHLPVVQQYEAVGHAVRAMYMYTAMTQVARETGDRDYYSAAMSLWDNVVNRKYYVTGGIGSGETAEGFGPDYSLPHRGYCEACASCGHIFFEHELHLLHGDACHVDLLEDTLYNALLGSLDLAGKNFYYTNPLDCRRPRYSWHACPCCVGNIARTLLQLPKWMYSRGPDTLCVNLFVGSEVRIPDVAGTDVKVVQVTDYPWDGRVKICLHPRTPAEFSLKIRMPNYSTSKLYRCTPKSSGIRSIILNGKPIHPPVERGYAVIKRLWQPGDSVELQLPLKVQRVHGIDKIRATRGQVALRYGPLIYTFESVDQALEGKSLDARAVLKTRWRDDLLGGVVVIEGTWSDGSPLTAIPYFARANRMPEGSGAGVLRSTVWVPEQTVH